jgi:predicted RNase H-like nuclease (RuvC/YqgF family)
MTIAEFMYQFGMSFITGGTLTVIVMAIIYKKKTKAETNKIDQDSVSVQIISSERSVKTAMQLEQRANERLKEETERHDNALEKINQMSKTIEELMQSLVEVKTELEEVRVELEEVRAKYKNERKYNYILIDYIEDCEFEVPARPEM